MGNETSIENVITWTFLVVSKLFILQTIVVEIIKRFKSFLCLLGFIYFIKAEQ